MVCTGSPAWTLIPRRFPGWLARPNHNCQRGVHHLLILVCPCELRRDYRRQHRDRSLSRLSADDISWRIDVVVSDGVGNMMGKYIEVQDVFLPFTVDQGMTVVNACELVRVNVILYNAHRLNSVTIWSLGIGGSEKMCKNLEMERLTKKLTACIGVFSHAVVNNDELNDMQTLREEFHVVYEFIRRNDTRCTSQHKMDEATISAAEDRHRRVLEEAPDQQAEADNERVDGNGEIDLNELRTVMTSLGYNPTDKQLQDMMDKVDLDGNGFICFAEFVMMMRKCKVDTDFDRQIREAFKFFDQDGSGAIDTKELGTIMRQLGAKLSDAEIDLLVKEADVDGDGQVDINEFLKIMYS